MAINSAELLAGEVSHKVDDLLSELMMLRRECSMQSAGSVGIEKAFVQAYQKVVEAGMSSDILAAKLERMLMVR